MTRLFTTTAVLLTLSGGAFAESHSATPMADTENKAESSTMTDNTGSSTTADSNATADTSAVAPSGTMSGDMKANMEIGAAASAPTDFYASNLIGMRIYNVEADYDTTMRIADGAETEWDDIGEINDLVVTADGKVSAVILGIGGFLGIGERDVAVNMGAITVVSEDGDGTDRFLVVKTDKEQLEALPEFSRDNM